MKVLDFALKMEQDAKAYYEKLAAETTSSELKNIFTLLAEAENSHCEALQARKEEKAFSSVESTVLQQSQNVFEKLTEMKALHGMFKVDPEGYLHAVKAEDESIKYYESAAEKEQNPEAKKLLLSIAAEEKIHLNIIQNIYEFVLTPRTHLEWREFSNLKQL